MQQLVLAEARSAGLGHRAPSLAAIDRRRTELLSLAVVVITGTALLASLAPHRLPWLAQTASTMGLRLTLGGLAAVFVAYVFEKEIHLRRLHRLLLDERVLSNAMAERASQVAELADGARAVNDGLDLGEVLTRLLDRALAMVGTESGAVLVVDEGPDGADGLVAACVRGAGREFGERIALDEGHVGRAMLGRRPTLDRGDRSARSVIAVPLLHRGDLLGALEVRAEGAREFTDYEVQVLALFADYVSVGLANARLYAVERTRVAELTELDELKSQFLANVSHELKTPLTSIIGCVSLLRRAALDEEEQADFFDSIDRQAKRLAEMVDQLLVAGRVQEDAGTAHEVADVAEVARMVATDIAVTGRAVELDLPDRCLVRCSPQPLQQVLWNLVDNAHKYGATPVRVEVAIRDTVVVLSVLDAGTGVPIEERERVFERFHRVDADSHRPGMGLGLPIVKRLLEARGGRVWIDDVAGGTAVRVALQVASEQGVGPSGPVRYAERRITDPS